MKIVLITDIHFGARNNSDFFLDNQRKFFSDVFFPYLEDNKIKTVFIMGDTWEDRKSICPKVFKAAREMFFDRLSSLKINVKIIYGNHDVFYKDTNEVNSIDVLSDLYDNIEVIKTFKEFRYGSLNIAMISWINKNNLEASLKFFEETQCTHLCGHFEIKNVPMIKGHNCQHGFDKSVFDKFERVFSGHFHTISDDGKIFYISNPFQTSWSDYGEKKGFRVLDTETKEIEFIQNPFDVYDTIVYNDDIDLMSFDFSKYENKIVKVLTKNLTGKSKDKIDLFIGELTKQCWQISVEEADDILTGSILSPETIEFQNTFSVISKYVDEVVNSDSVDKNKLLSIFNELYEKAQSGNEAV